MSYDWATMSNSLIRYLWIIFYAWMIYNVFRFLRFLRILRTFGRAIEQFPMDDRHWLKGHLHKLTSQGEESLSYFLELMTKYPKVCSLYLINYLRPYVAVYHPDTVKIVLKAAGRKTLKHGIYYFGIRWFGDGLVLSSGSKWQRNRRLLTPLFHQDALHQYIKVVNQTSDIFLAKLSEFAKSDKTFDIYTLTINLTMDTILRCALSYDNDIQAKCGEHFYAKAVDMLIQLWNKRQYELLKYFDFIYWKTKDGHTFMKYCNLVHEFAYKFIRDRRKLIAENPNDAENYHDFLDILIRSKDEDGKGLTDEEIKDEINTFMAAGSETTAATISWTLYNLGSNPKHQKICQKEIDNIFEGRTNDAISWQDMQNMPYLEMCIKETLRLHGPPLIERELEEDIFIDGKLVPTGSKVLVLFYCLHHDPEIWDNPMKFDPGRFSSPNSEYLESSAFFPFSSGLRNCIGQSFAMKEMKVIIAKVLRRFDLSVEENFIPKKIIAATLKSSNGIFLKFSERKRNY